METPDPFGGDVVVCIQIRLVWSFSMITETPTDQCFLLIGSEMAGQDDKPYALFIKCAFLLFL